MEDPSAEWDDVEMVCVFWFARPTEIYLWLHLYPFTCFTMWGESRMRLTWKNLFASVALALLAFHLAFFLSLFDDHRQYRVYILLMYACILTFFYIHGQKLMKWLEERSSKNLAIKPKVFLLQVPCFRQRLEIKVERVI